MGSASSSPEPLSPLVKDLPQLKTFARTEESLSTCTTINFVTINTMVSEPNVAPNVVGMTMPSLLTMSLETVVLRLSETQIAVYKDMLSTVSPYFQKAFRGSSPEAQDRSIHLDDVSEQTFRIFLQWAFCQTYPPLSSYDLFKPDVLVKEEERASHNSSRADEDADEDLDVRSSDTSSKASHDDTLDDVKEFSADDHVESPEWRENYRSFVLSLLHLFIFADKYDVSQLRDDIITALVIQGRSWHWWPDPDTELVAAMHGNLPKTSTFAKMIACCAAIYWLPEKGEDEASRVRLLHEMHPDFVFNVGLVQAEALKGYISKENWTLITP